MKCYTLSDNSVSQGVDLAGLPVDDTLSGVKNVRTMKLMILFRERDGILPEQLLDEDVGRASACGRVVVTKSSKNTAARFVVFFDPRKWFVDPSCGKSGFVVYRSRDRFAAFAKDQGFRMRSADGSSVLSVDSKWSPKVESDANRRTPSAKPEDGWFLATME